MPSADGIGCFCNSKNFCLTWDSHLQYFLQRLFQLVMSTHLLKLYTTEGIHGWSHCPQKSTNFNKEATKIFPKSLVIYSIKGGRKLICTCHSVQCICQSWSERWICLSFYQIIAQFLLKIYPTPLRNHSLNGGGKNTRKEYLDILYNSV